MQQKHHFCCIFATKKCSSCCAQIGRSSCCKILLQNAAAAFCNNTKQPLSALTTHYQKSNTKKKSFSTSTTTTTMALPLAGRVAIVTGSSRGIGRAIATHLASLGASLVINYVSSSVQADLLVSELNSNSTTVRAITVQADVSDQSGAKSLFDRAEEAFGSPVHIFINSAGVIDSKYSTISSIPVEDLDKIFNTNVRGAFLCCQEAANRIARGGSGRIIMVSSSLVGALLPKYGAYTASKAAVETMVKILAKELKGTKITANCLAPGPIATELFFEGKSEEDVKRLADSNPMERIGETKDVAPVVGFLCTDQGEWVNGQVIRVNGGFV